MRTSREVVPWPSDLLPQKRVALAPVGQQAAVGEVEARMGYSGVGEFQTDFVRAQERAKRFHGDNSQTKPMEWALGWKLYDFASKPALGMQTFGRHITGAKAKALNDWKAKNPGADQLPAHLIGMNHGEKFFANFNVVNEAADGSILLMGGNKWSFTINDTWILGGVHAHIPFYPASILDKANLHHPEYVLSITGRELIGLALFGYKEVKGHRSVGSAFVVSDKAKAGAARLVAYQDAISGITKWSQAKAIYKSAGLDL